MSSADPGERSTPGEPDPGEPGADDPRGHEGAPAVPLDAPVESAPADDSLGTTPSAADREPVPAAGAPAELTSDDDRPGQSPDGTTGPPEASQPSQGTTPTPAARPVVIDGFPPGKVPPGPIAAGAVPSAAPAVTTTSSAAADDVPVVDDAAGGAVEATAEGGDTRAEGRAAPAGTAADDPGAADPRQPEAAPPPAPADVADERPTEADTADGTEVPAGSSALAVTDTDVADAQAARGEVSAPASGAAEAEPTGPAPSVDVHAEPSETDAPGDDAAEPAQAVAPAVAAADVPADPAAVDPAAAGDVAAPAQTAGADGSEAPAEVEVATEPEPAPVDEERQPLLDLLAEHLGDGLLGTHVVVGKDMTVRVSRDAWVRAAEVCRDVLGLRQFSFLSAMDWMPSPYGRSEDGGLAGVGADAAVATADPTSFEPGTTGGATRFQVLARLQAVTPPAIGVNLKCDVPADDLVMPTWTKVFPGADWHERETKEMFGIDFAGHQHLVKLYLPGDFEGYPLRKDFPLLARDVKPWPGLVDVEAMPGEEESPEEGSADEPGAAVGAEEA